jgi:hypothetical protein
MKALAVLLVASCLASSAAAGNITLTITQRARVAGGSLVVELEIGNRGDEAALSVVPTLVLGEQRVSGEGQPTLAPDGSFTETLTLPIGARGEGRWPYQLRVDYTDTNQYPFQALEMRTFAIGSPPPARLMPAVVSTAIEQAGVLEVTVKNLSAVARPTRVAVILPDMLEAPEDARELELDAWQESRFEVPVTNKGALVGSSHPVFAVAEYEDGPLHQTLVAQGAVRVTAPDPFLTRHGRALSWLGAGLLGVWLAALLAVPLRRRLARPV